MVQIEVLQSWSGEPSGFRQIMPGVYDAKDERLYGCAGYLLEHGYAQRVADADPIESAILDAIILHGTDADDQTIINTAVESVKDQLAEILNSADEPEIAETTDEPTSDTDESQDEPKHRRRSK